MENGLKGKKTIVFVEELSNGQDYNFVCMLLPQIIPCYPFHYKAR